MTTDLKDIFIALKYISEINKPDNNSAYLFFGIIISFILLLFIITVVCLIFYFNNKIDKINIKNQISRKKVTEKLSNVKPVQPIIQKYYIPIVEKPFVNQTHETIEGFASYKLPLNNSNINDVNYNGYSNIQNSYMLLN